MDFQGEKEERERDMAINSIASTESDTIHLFRMKFSNTFTLVFIIINMARQQQVGDCVVVNIHACTDDFCKVMKKKNSSMTHPVKI